VRAIVTGCSGFIGGALLGQLTREPELDVVGVSRVRPAELVVNTRWLPRSLLTQSDTNLGFVSGSVVIHAAGRAHILRERGGEPLAEYRRSNVDETLEIAEHAARCGVQRFIFLSSVKVNGEAAPQCHPFTADDVAKPLDPYGVSKMEAEQGLQELSVRSGMEITIIRPPLVYGPGVKGNFLSMMRWLGRGVPLPLGAIHNLRSLVAIDNLVDLIATCVYRPAAANQTFLVSDGEDLSTTLLLRRLGAALEKPARLVTVPEQLLMLAATVVGKGDVARRLCGSLCVDITKTRQLLGWSPPVSVDEGLRRTAEAFRREAHL
jgi:nucleoside-diphosphate-sugar epimerase